MSYFQVTFNTIQCKLPSAGVDITAAEAAEAALSITSKVGSIGSLICTAVGPEAAPVGLAFTAVSAVADLGAEIDNLIVALDKQSRETGGEPDNFYISWFAPGIIPTQAEAYKTSDGTYPTVLYPVANAYPKDNHVDLAIGQFAPNLPQTLTVNVLGSPMLSLPMGIGFWDYDEDSTDDSLWSLSLDPNNTGNFKTCYYNALQDSWYFIDYSVAYFA